MLMFRDKTTSLDVLQEAPYDDYWNMDGDKSSSDPWTGVTRFALLNNIPLEGYTWVQGKLTKKHVATRPGNIWAEEWSHMSKCLHCKATNKWAEENPNWTRQEDNARRKSETRRASAMPSWSPQQPTRTVQAEGDPVQVII